MMMICIKTVIKSLEKLDNLISTLLRKTENGYIMFKWFITYLFFMLLVTIQHQPGYAQQPISVSIPLHLAWNRNTEADINSYRVYWRKPAEDYSKAYGKFLVIDKNKTECDLGSSQLTVGESYYIALTAFDHSGNESGYSDALFIFIESALPTTTIPNTTTTISKSNPFIPLPPAVSTTTVPSTTSSTVKPDTTPPVGTITINRGDAVTHLGLVTLYLSAADNESGMGTGAQMMLSNDNQQWYGPTPFSSSKSWVLSPGEGVKKVYAKFCDAAGNWMAEPVNNSIELKLSCAAPIQLETTATGCSGSYLPLWSEVRAVDGKTATGWLSPLRRSLQDEYITLDLGEIKLINRIDIYSNRFMALDLFPRDFKVLVSTDNQIWTDIFAEQDYMPPVSHTGSWTFDDTEARYVRLVATRTQKFMFFFYLTYIAEIKVFGCAEPETPGTELTSAQAGPRLLKQATDIQAADNKKPGADGKAPGRPGKPLFILQETK